MKCRPCPFFMICILSLVDHIYSLKPNPDMPSTSQQPDAFLLYQAKKAPEWRDKRKVRSLLCNITWCCVFQNCFVCSRHHQNGSSLNDIPFTRKWLGFVTFFNSYLMAVLKTRQYLRHASGPHTFFLKVQTVSLNCFLQSLMIVSLVHILTSLMYFPLSQQNRVFS